MLEIALLKKYGPEKLSEHYQEFETICDATEVRGASPPCCPYLLSPGVLWFVHCHRGRQERQDAVVRMIETVPALDLVMVVGGYKSHNTKHLHEIAVGLGKRQDRRPRPIR